MAFSVSLVNAALYPWTEQLHLFFILLVLFIYLKNKKASFSLGVILAISCLVRVAGLVNFGAFMLALFIIKGFSQEAFKEYARLALGFLGILLCYELFCYIKYGVFFPQYLGPAKVYIGVKIFPGAFYNNTLPVLNMPPLKQGFEIIILNTYKHVIDFIISFKNIKFMLVFVPICALYDLIKRKEPLLILFFCQGAVIILSCLYSSSWYPEPIDAQRYSLIPIITIGSIGFLYIREIFVKLAPKRIKFLPPAVFAVIILSFLCANISEYFDFRKYCLDIYPVLWGDFNKSRDRMYEWIRTNTDSEALIASERSRDVVLFNRPFVSLPLGQAATRENLIRCLEIYKPDYILTLIKNADMISFLKRLGFREEKVCGELVLLNRSK